MEMWRACAQRGATVLGGNARVSTGSEGATAPALPPLEIGVAGRLAHRGRGGDTTPRASRRRWAGRRPRGLTDEVRGLAPVGGVVRSRRTVETLERLLLQRACHGTSYEVVRACREEVDELLIAQGLCSAVRAAVAQLALPVVPQMHVERVALLGLMHVAWTSMRGPWPWGQSSGASSTFVFTPRRRKSSRIACSPVSPMSTVISFTYMRTKVSASCSLMPRPNCRA